MTTARPRLRARAPEVLTAMVSLAVALAGLELAFGVVNHAAGRSRVPHPHGEMSDFTRYHPILGWDGIPGVRLPLVNNVVALNSAGNRSPEVTFQKPPGVRRVVLLGDSQAWSLGVADDQTIGAQLEARLNARGAQRWQVINLGVSGYGTDQAYLKHLLQGLRYEPDAVVEVVFKNDLLENAATHAWEVDKPRFYFEGQKLCLGNVPPHKVAGWPEDALLSGAAQSLLSWSQTYRFFQRRSWRFARAPRPDPADLERLRPYLDCLANRESYPGDGSAIMLALLRRLDALERSRGSHLVTLFVPRPVEYRRKGRSTYYAAVLAELQRSGLATLDLRQYAAAQRLQASELFLERDSHLSARGCAVAAEALAAELP